MAIIHSKHVKSPLPKHHLYTHMLHHKHTRKRGYTCHI